VEPPGLLIVVNERYATRRTAGRRLVDRGLHATGTVASPFIIEINDPIDNYFLRLCSCFEMMSKQLIV
jgi:hypothetical protein